MNKNIMRLILGSISIVLVWFIALLLVGNACGSVRVMYDSLYNGAIPMPGASMLPFVGTLLIAQILSALLTALTILIAKLWNKLLEKSIRCITNLLVYLLIIVLLATASFAMGWIHGVIGTAIAEGIVIICVIYLCVRG